jgi:hypothetical protein
MKTLWVILLLVLFTACDKLFIEDDAGNTPLNNYNLLWETVDEYYCYFDYKDVNWDDVYWKYRPQITRSISDEALFNVFAEMLNELKDGHVNLYASFNTSRYWDWFLDYPQNFNSTIIERNYLKEDHLLAGGLKFQMLTSMVGYLRYASFMNAAPGSFLKFVFDNYDMQGLIIDVRDNGGGITYWADTLASNFISQKMLIGYIRYKDGPGHDDFTDPFPRYLEPSGNRFSKPVIVLTNRSVYSAANYFVSIMGQLPQVTLLGDQTGGGGGVPLSSELYNGWRVRFSTNPITDAHQKNIELGIGPDIAVDLDSVDLQNGIDTMIETAIEILGE